MSKRLILFLLLLFGSGNVSAGPPYDTDDPEPVSLHHWEVYLSSHAVNDHMQFAGTAPHLEVNYGAVPNLQLHIIAPLYFSANKNESSVNYGYGDTEIGIKYKFIKETSTCPQIGIFPLVELPSGNPNKELGNGEAQIYLPIWVQKTIGKWTTYGGAGYWINPGKGNRNWQYYGWQAQYQFLETMSMGAELYHVTSSEVDGQGETRFNVGTVIDLSSYSHILFSIGSSINGSTQEQGYIGYQLTFGKD